MKLNSYWKSIIILIIEILALVLILFLAINYREAMVEYVPTVMQSSLKTCINNLEY